jgi:5-methylcytosine-specific restriction endonuclease McrA
LFNVLGNERICPACQKALEEKFQEVKAYLRENPDSSVEKTATDNDVSTKQIKQWVREERLILSSATDSGITCESCGKPICSGRFCEACKANMANNLMGALDRPKKVIEQPQKSHERDRMRFLKN